MADRRGIRPRPAAEPVHGPAVGPRDPSGQSRHVTLTETLAELERTDPAVAAAAAAAAYDDTIDRINTDAALHRFRPLPWDRRTVDRHRAALDLLREARSMRARGVTDTSGRTGEWTEWDRRVDVLLSADE